MGPFGSPVFGAGAPCQVLPASLVHATDVQMKGLTLAHLPGIPACPITQALSVLMNVTEEGWKLAGTGPCGGDSTLAELPGLGVWLGDCDGDGVSKLALLGDCETLWLAALCPAAGFTGTEEVVRCIEVSAGTPGKCANANPSICTSVAWTGDAGKTWHGAPAPNTGAPSGPTGVGGIRFLDGINGWAFGPELWATHDAGHTWHQVPTDGRRVTDLEAVGNRAYALFASCSGTHAFSYADGCTSYTLMTATADSDEWAPAGQATTGLTALGNGASITLTGSEGYLVSPDGTLYSGPIGGAWKQAGKLPCLTGTPQPSGLPLGTLLAVAGGAPRLTAVCVGSAPNEPSRVFTSGDGASWTQQPAAAWGSLAVPVDPTSLTAAPDGTLVLATSHGLYVLPSGASQWKAATAANAPSRGFSYVGMTTDSQGVALPADTTRHEIWMTFDGGLTWAPRTVAG